MSVNENRNDSLKEIHTTFDSDGTVKNSKNKGGIAPKILSVVAAIALWLYVFQAVEYEKTFNGIPVEVEENFDSVSGLGIVSNNSLYVDITLSGTKSNIDSITAEDIRAFVDLTDVTEADVYNCTIELEVPETVDVVEKSQEQVRVEVDRKIEKVVENISVNEVFTVESPFELGEITVTDIYHEPVEFLTLTGPEADISLVERAVINLDLGKVRNSILSNISAEKSVTLYDIAGKKIDTKYIGIEPSTIGIYIPVYKTKQLEIKPDVLYDSEKFTYKTDIEKVDAYGLVDDVDRLGFVETEKVEITEDTVYLAGLKEHDGVRYYKSGSDKTEKNAVNHVSIIVSEIEYEEPFPEKTENS